MGAGEDITLNGTGVSNAGALRNIVGDNIINSNITLSTNAVRINSDEDGESDTLLTINGTISNSTLALTFGGAGNTTVTGAIGDGAGTLTKDGSGTLTLTAANTYTGKTTISNGTIVVSGSGTIGDGASALDIDGTGTLDLQNTSTTGTLTI
ncbi:MAG: hypothetical protein EBW81_09565, partial [Gammaproteobacteria bacterium]|nr:hypothetical protein [Gammaproteobacteria bacterium]